jgi:hypothetical protein
MLGLVVPFCSVFILLGCGLMFLSGRRIIEGWRATHWPHTTGTLVSVQSRDTSDSDSTSREILVRYSYTVENRDHEGTTIHPTYGSSSFEEAHQGLERLLRPGRRVRVYYRVDAPERSTLAVGFYSGSLALFCGGTLFAVAGLGFLLTCCFALAGNWNYAAGVIVVE